MLSELPWIPVIHIQSLQVTLRDFRQIVNKVAETRSCCDVDARLSALIIIVDNGRALMVTQKDGAQDPISTLKKGVREIPS